MRPLPRVLFPAAFPLVMGALLIAWAAKIQFQTTWHRVAETVFGPMVVSVVEFAWFDTATVGVAGAMLLYYGVATWRRGRRSTGNTGV